MRGNKFKHLTIFYDDGVVDSWYIENFEKTINFSLPSTYKELIMKHNGAGFFENEFSFINHKGEKDGRQFVFKSFGEKEDVEESIEEAQIYVSDPKFYGIPNMVAFASTGEGDTLCFDYRNILGNCEPKIALMIHDEYKTNEDGSISKIVEYIADSFDEFLEILYEDK